ncbi:hypothetical protein G6F62_015965 [Rhizopus arrhizus]|nr:hypothetical protein G6F62_015965 [Rhizopus arrhizus]
MAAHFSGWTRRSPKCTARSSTYSALRWDKPALRSPSTPTRSTATGVGRLPTASMNLVQTASAALVDF